MIDTREWRDVVIADVVGAYLLVNMADYAVVRITGKSVDIMCEVSKSYEKHVGIENGKRVLYLRLKNYCMVACSLQFYGTIHSRIVMIYVQQTWI